MDFPSQKARFLSSLRSNNLSLHCVANPLLRNGNTMDEFLNVKDLADFLRTTPNAIYVARAEGAERNGSLPRSAEIPKSTRVLWKKSEVERWMEGLS